ncbi:MAG: dephospho-CoA kinase [Cellulomonas sp.]|uniref:dephospho-CoA kinase n=1 Tax=Cellulomonas sp. TaxID=40001 RepID=UPI0017AC3553|nr:dephospho-CoA kinase [Cellulomonas sp.]NMM31941.1 dephospho-CoA kinase [Cellulomonas sp.]
MQRIGLTGGIAAGKSVAARRLTELGAVVIDADQLARRALAPGTPGLEDVVAEFGPSIVTGDGELDRAGLASIVFADRAALDRLNTIVHPIVRRLAAELEASAATVDPDAVVVHDIPLLIESGQTGAFHLVVVVDAPAVLRVERLIGTRGLSRDEAEARVSAQASDAERLEVADVVLDGAGSDANLRSQIDDLWARLAAERSAEAAAERG